MRSLLPASVVLALSLLVGCPDPQPASQPEEAVRQTPVEAYRALKAAAAAQDVAAFKAALSQSTRTGMRERMQNEVERARTSEMEALALQRNLGLDTSPLEMRLEELVDARLRTQLASPGQADRAFGRRLLSHRTAGPGQAILIVDIPVPGPDGQDVGQAVELQCAWEDGSWRLDLEGSGKTRAAGLRLIPVADPRSRVTSVRFTRDGTQLVVVSRRRGQGRFTLWDAVTGELIRGVDAERLQQAAPITQRQLLVSGERSQADGGATVRVWSLPTLESLGELPVTGGVSQLVPAPDGRLLVLTSRLTLFDLETRTIVWERPREWRRLATATGPDRFAGVRPRADGQPGAELSICRVADGEEEVTIPLQVPVYSLALSPNGQVLAVGSQRKLLLFDATTGQLTHDLFMPGRTSAVAFSPDGREVAAKAIFLRRFTLAGELIYHHWPLGGSGDEDLWLAYHPEGGAIATLHTQTVALFRTDTPRLGTGGQ